MTKRRTTTWKHRRISGPKAPATEIDPSFAPVVEALANDRHVTYGRMFASMGLKVNGKIFAMLVKGRFVAKLPKERVDDLVRTGKGEYFDPGHGRLMKEWVVLDSEPGSWVGLAREAHRFVKGGRI
jgi:TfoX/Sxy family transcriptional regulator of competence genes